MYRIPDKFEVERPKTAWGSTKPIIDNEEEKKHLFGIELAKYSPFEAACNIFKEDTNTAVWVSQNWLNDPIVVAAKDKYLEAADKSQELLDKSQLARKLLTMAEEKNASNTFYLLDGKDRLKALELYSKIMGYSTDKPDPSIQQFIHNSMTIKLVSAEKEQKPKIINNEEDTNTNFKSPIKLKLVG